MKQRSEYTTIEQAINAAIAICHNTKFTQDKSDGANLVKTGYDLNGNELFNIYKSFSKSLKPVYIVNYKSTN